MEQWDLSNLRVNWCMMRFGELDHTLQEASLRKIKCHKHSANAGVSKKPIQKFWDVSKLFWMGDFGDNPPKTHFFRIFWTLRTYFLGSMTIFGITLGSFGGLTSKFLDWSYGFEAKYSKNWLILGINYRVILIKSNILWHRPHLKSTYLRPYIHLDPKNKFWGPKMDF